jgi:hypothetical protein
MFLDIDVPSTDCDLMWSGYIRAFDEIVGCAKGAAQLPDHITEFAAADAVQLAQTA